MDIYQYDEGYRNKGFRFIAGVDEAGRGPLAGPVVAAAVILPRKTKIDGLRDSKKVPPHTLPDLFWDVLTVAEGIGIGIIEHEEIDRVNILKATKRAMKDALNDLPHHPDLVIVDAVKLPDVRLKQLSLIRGDSKSAAVAAASIIAKYARDSIMLRYHDLYPVYNFRNHKGYGTQEHIHKLHAYGPCPIHRKSFKKVMSVMLPFDE